MNTLGIYTKTTTGGFKGDLMVAFENGVKSDIDGWSTKLIDSHKIENTSHAICFNYQFKADKEKPRIKLRQELWERFKSTGNIWFYDSNVLVAYESERHHPQNSYVRIAYGNVYPDKTNYFNKNSPSDRWEKMKKNLNLEIKDYKKDKKNILICCNRGSGGYSAFGKNAADWALETVDIIRRYTDRPITIRQHKGKGYTNYLQDRTKLYEAKKYIKDLDIQSPDGNYPDLITSIKDSYAVVIFTSSAGAPAIIEGKPLFVCHPSSYLYSMNAGDISKIENPNLDLNRQQFLNNLGYSHWTYEEIKNGVYWKRIKRFL